MSEQPKLKPCHCGEPINIEPDAEEITCRCGIAFYFWMEPVSVPYDQSALIGAWNTRPAEAELAGIAHKAINTLEAMDAGKVYEPGTLNLNAELERTRLRELGYPEKSEDE